MSRGWAPLATGETARRARAAVEAIARDIEAGVATAAPGLDPSLQRGEAGLALFFAYLGREPGRGEAAQRAWQHLDRAVSALAREPAGPSLYRGFAGVAWVAEHLAATAEDDPAGDPNAEIDQALLTLLARSPWRGEVDLLGGLVGFGVYALERLPRAAAAEEMLRLLLARLGECAERRGEGLVWPAPGGPGPDADPGTAHGVAGIIGLLARIVRGGVEAGAAGSLLTAAVEGALPRDFTADDDLAWCSGGAGLAVALLAAGRAVGRPDWERDALRLAGAAARRDLAACPDAGLCHGTAGLCHLFHRLYRATGDPLFRETAERWLERTLAARRPGEGLGGYLRPRRPADGAGWSLSDGALPDGALPEGLPEPGFLGGAAGTGLALLAAVSEVEPAWDRVLLLSGT